jgi:hypothetical protein
MEINSNHAANEGANTSEKSLTNSAKQLMDGYTKQLNVVTGFYKNMFDSVLAVNKEWTTPNYYSNSLFGNGTAKAFAMPFNEVSNNATSPFLPTFYNFYKQISDYYSTTFSNLTVGLKSNVASSEFSKKYSDNVTTLLETAKAILKTAIEAYSKQLDFSMETTKKAVEEMTIQFNAMLKQNQNIWADVIASAQTTLNNEEKNLKDSISPEIKKRAGSLVTELSNHKI